MKNMMQMMKQAQQMQAKMTAMQEELANLEITGQSAGGMIRITLNGKGEMRAIAIDKSLLNPDEGEILEDLIVAAFADAKSKSEQKAAEEMGKITGGLNIPGLKLPF